MRQKLETLTRRRKSRTSIKIQEGNQKPMRKKKREAGTKLPKEETTPPKDISKFLTITITITHLSPNPIT